MIARYQAIERILSHIREADLVVSTTGMISRELFTLDDRPGNFYMIGSMGLASAMGLGLAIQAPHKRVFVLEGDGSALMSLGTLPLISSEQPSNLFHIILDNEAYESTGGQPSISSQFDLAETARSAGYPWTRRVDDLEELESALTEVTAAGQLSLIVVKAGIAPVDGIPRVSHTPEQIRDRFKSAVQA
ncbi:MAG: sulfopyruvate decarboxylase subunit beta [Chloroflexi bacterium]|nr:thiamine pyrophosphate-dependent enzyme [Dehalococcoidia bacterium]PCJ79020.1 MAG: sulfopyruvate decarboxylase subunit beta [Dehalococcoidia bacterium]RUA19630.1 MAG: sulfopyruvate decarboxylase subunit beta [Chloroflexota bacterium]RUA32746.1 MAG: sulfopyruvate decarboxylase subunit beta [Chloroflexota bacterium]